MRMLHPFRLAPSVVLLVGASLALSSGSACDNGAHPGGLDAGPTGDTYVPSPDAADASMPTESAADADADALVDANESLAPFNLGVNTGGALFGAASSDGSAMLLIQNNVASKLQWSHYEVATGWSAVADLSGGDSPYGGAPQLGIDASGNAFVAWIGKGDGGHTLSVARYDHAGSTWGAVQQPDSYEGTFNEGAVLAVNAGGEALAIALHNGAGPHDVVAEHYAGGTWTQETVEALSHGTGTSMPVVSLADTGLAVAAFNSDTGLNVATRTGTAWTVISSTLPTAAFYSFGAAINGVGDVLVGFLESDTLVYTYQYDAAANKWTGPKARGTTSELSLYIGCPVVVGLSSSGDGVVARCFQGTGVTRTLESYAYAKTTDSWGAATSLPASGWPFDMSFAFDSAGDGLAAWTNAPTSGYQTEPPVLSQFEADSGWSAQSPPLGGNAGSYATAPFLSPNGRGWVAWNEGSSAVVKKVR